MLRPEGKSTKVVDCQVATDRGLFHIVRAIHEGEGEKEKKDNGKTANTFEAHPIKTVPFAPIGIPPLPWEAVGVRRFKAVDRSRLEMLRREEITAKIMTCAGVMTEWEKSWLMSKKEQ